MKYDHFLIAPGQWVFGVQADGTQVGLHPFLPGSILPPPPYSKIALVPPVALPGEYLWSPSSDGLKEVLGIYWYLERYNYHYQNSSNQALVGDGLIRVCR